MQPALRLGGHVARRGGGVDPFVQVNNLNRLSSLPGYFNTAHEAGRHSFTLDSEYLWYGMLLRKLPSSRFAESECSRARRNCLRNSQRGHALLDAAASNSHQ